MALELIPPVGHDVAIAHGETATWDFKRDTGWVQVYNSATADAASRITDIRAHANWATFAKRPELGGRAFHVPQDADSIAVLILATTATAVNFQMWGLDTYETKLPVVADADHSYTGLQKVPGELELSTAIAFGGAYNLENDVPAALAAGYFTATTSANHVWPYNTVKLDGGDATVNVKPIWDDVNGTTYYAAPIKFVDHNWPVYMPHVLTANAIVLMKAWKGS